MSGAGARRPPGAAPGVAAARGVAARGVAAGHRLAAAAGVAGLLLLASAGLASAHPLGNFTINHYAGLRLAADRVDLDVVIDMAEIPAFQERQQLDRNGDGTVDPSEVDQGRRSLCPSLARSLALTAAGRPVSLALDAAGLSFPAGSSGLPTLRLVCELHGALGTSPAGREVAFVDDSYAGRIGWREIVVQGDGLRPIASSDGAPVAFLATSVSQRLTHYPTDLLATPLAMASVDVRLEPGAPGLARALAPDAWPLAATTAGPGRGAISSGPADAKAVEAIAGAVPGGIGESLGSILDVRDLTPSILLLSLLAAVLLGAAHALSPGHGKTVIAAYLVGTRGTHSQAAALGLVVTLSHTLGVLVLAGLVVGASAVVAPERLYPVLGVASGLLVVAIGLSLVAGRLAAWRGRLGGLPHGHDHDHSHDHDHDHGHDHDHEVAGAGHVHRHGVGPFAHEHGPAPAAVGDSAGPSLRWRSLVALGLAGGLVPSASALLLLLGALAANRPAYGLVLVVAFGAGMAVVLVGVGLALVSAGRLVERLRPHRRLRLVGRAVPALTAVAVLLGGVVLTVEALHQVL